MNITLISVLLLMLLSVFILSKVMHFPRNIWVLFLTQPLWLCISPTMTLIGGLLATKIAPSPTLATLPLTLLIIGLALSTFLVAKLSEQYGRKTATHIGFIIALLATLLAMCAALIANFYVLLVAAFFLGSSLAFSQQLRFAAIESVSPDQTAKVISALMLGGIFAAFIGPEVAVLAKDWIPSPHGFAGSFLALAILIVCAMVIFQGFTNPDMKNQEACDLPVRPIKEIIKQPIFIIALLSAVIGYGLMSLLMTATPLSMHDMNGHSLEHTKWVIQSHIAAMFLPSLFTGILIKRFHSVNILLVGTIIFAAVSVVALSGQQVIHYWWALVLLGIGWNFLFITGTVLLPESYRVQERFKVQALNDFTIFTVQALASLFSGWILFQTNWNTLVYSTIPFIIIMFVICIYFNNYRKQQTK